MKSAFRASDYSDGLLAGVFVLLAGIVLLRPTLLVPARPANESVVVAAGRRLPAPTDPQSLAGVPLLGAKTAPVVIMVYSDFECPYCKVFAETALPQIRAELVDTGKAAVAFRHYPLDAIHPVARQAAVVAACAADQGAFWKVHDLLFASAARLDNERLQDVIVRASLDPAQIAACGEAEGNVRVRLDAASGRALLVRATPSFALGLRTSPDEMQVLRVISGVMTADQLLNELATMGASVGTPAG